MQLPRFTPLSLRLALSIALCMATDQSSARTPAHSTSTSDFFDMWNDIVDETESVYESPPDSPYDSETHNPVPGNDSDNEAVDIRGALCRFTEEVTTVVDDLNRKTGNKYNFSPPPTPPRFLRGEDDVDEEDPPEELPQKNEKEEVTFGSLTWTALPYITSFLLLNGAFLYFSATPQGVVFIAMLLSMLGMLLLPALFLARNFGTVMAYWMSGK